MIGKTINKLRTGAKLSQEQFAEMLGVSRQSVQKWESDLAVPELDKLIKIAKYFDVTLDTLVLNSDPRMTDALANRELKPNYANLHSWESYSSNLKTEYQQSVEEGLELGVYADLFSAVAKLPKDEIKKRLGDILFDIVRQAKPVANYPYTEPSSIEEIRALRVGGVDLPPVDRAKLEKQIHGAWMGRICGCLLGKTVEGIKTNELIPFLKETGNYPMHRYILQKDLNDEILSKYNFRFAGRCYADAVDGMPVDDDTNYVVLAQKVIEKYGRDFTPHNVAHIWLSRQGKDAYCTAERVAYCNLVNGFDPPESAIYQNPYREWIGAQIRGDYFGYINPGDPELAADMAFRDASISHVKNGIYGEMFISAMLAAAACTPSIRDIIEAGLGQIPSTSRLYEAIRAIVNSFESGVSQADCFAEIHRQYDEYSSHGWCHTISNAMIVVASLLYGKGDYGASICMAVETGFDTDCNGATVGSILGMANGIDSIGSVWTAPIQDTLYTSIFGVGKARISELVQKTLQHLKA